MSTQGFKYVYGPVPSRRLGRSLGVDLVPYKICTYDCVYCQLGRTTNKTVERASFAPVEEILADVKRKVEVIGHATEPLLGPHDTPETRLADVLALLQRRPCTVKDVADGLGVHVNEVLKELDTLVKTGKVTTSVVGDRVFYAAGRHEQGGP